LDKNNSDGLFYSLLLIDCFGLLVIYRQIAYYRPWDVIDSTGKSNDNLDNGTIAILP